MLRRFFIALQFMTRFPVPRTEAPQDLGKAAAFFPLVGVIVGLSAALAFVLLQRVLPLPVSILGAMILAALLTNALHEDGFADVFDGFGGGWSKERTLEIMRDSRIGVYGVLALIFLVLSKLQLLSTLSTDQIWRWLIVGHAAGRWAPLALGAWLPPASKEGLGRLVAKRSGAVEIVIGTVTVAIVLLLTVPWQSALIASVVTAFVTLLSGLYFRRRLQGITGDCMGASVQFTELALYLTAAILKSLTLFPI
ncbi:MAG TPA: adenosylcobinamide-GDP ribazoletransferase [Pyrinomonadaceae bacterium]|nr:adenosylcobinamide-GDP ribazoletransferase [Pyrinomonadaceae bacterium]